MKFLIYDLETTGLPKFNQPFTNLDAYSNCRIVEIAWIIIDHLRVVKARSQIIKPNNYESIPEIAQNIHGISFDFANENGKELTSILTEFTQDLFSCDAGVCHNVNFDKNVISSELYRLGNESLANQVNEYLHYCTMLEGKKHYKLYKYPKLSELYYSIYQQEPKQLHHALADVITCYECFKFLNPN